MGSIKQNKDLEQVLRQLENTLREGLPFIILDRDGTLNYDSGYVHKKEDLKLHKGVIEGLTLLNDYYRFVVISNQSGVPEGNFTIKDMNKFNDELTKKLSKNGIKIEKIYSCVDSPYLPLNRRKPNPTYLFQAKEEFNIDLGKSWVIGDRIKTDIKMANDACCKSVLVQTGHQRGKYFNKFEIYGVDIDKTGIKPDYVAENLFEAAKFIIRNDEPRLNDYKKLLKLDKIYKTLRS